MSLFQRFASEWLGRRVDADGAYSFQCVDLILQYMNEGWGIPIAGYGNAIDFASTTDSRILAHFDHVGGTAVREGDIVILSGVSSNPYGHITIASGRTGSSTYEGLEQNGSTGNGDGTGGNAIRLRYISTSRIAGILRPKSNQGGSIVLTKEEVQEIHQLAFQGEYPPDSVVQAWVGKDLGSYLQWLHQGGTWQDRTKAIKDLESGDAATKIAKIKEILGE